jgi:hypothetical protein
METIMALGSVGVLFFFTLLFVLGILIPLFLNPILTGELWRIKII